MFLINIKRTPNTIAMIRITYIEIFMYLFALGMSLVIMILDKSTQITAEKPIYSPLDTLTILKTDDKAEKSYWSTMNDTIILSILEITVRENPIEANILQYLKKPVYVLRLSNSAKILVAWSGTL